MDLPRRRMRSVINLERDVIRRASHRWRSTAVTIGI
jgi:hypothetical protein